MTNTDYDYEPAAYELPQQCTLCGAWDDERCASDCAGYWDEYEDVWGREDK